MYRKVWTTVGLSVWLALEAPAQIPPGYEVVQIAGEPYAEFGARINNRGQIVYVGWLDGSTRSSQEIFLYDNGTTVRITNDNVQNVTPDINDDGTLVWARGIGPIDPITGEPSQEIVMYRGGVLTRLTDNGDSDAGPSINSLGEVVWRRYMAPGCRGPFMDIYHYDGQRIRAITTDGVPEQVANQGARINDLGQIVWTRFDFCAVPWESDIMLYDNGVTTQLTSTEIAPAAPDIDNLGRVAWFDRDTAFHSIKFWDNGVTTLLTDWGSGPLLNDRGHVAFSRWHDTTGNWQQWLYRDGTFWQLSNDPFWNCCGEINEAGEVVWHSGPTGRRDLRLMRRMPTGDLNCDGAFNGADIDPFFLALGDPSAYATAFPDCDPLLGDVNGDGSLNGADIDPFFELLGG